MASLRALLSSTPCSTTDIKEEPEDAVIAPKTRVLKRAAFEEWHTRKFLAQPSTAHDIENRPEAFNKRTRHEESARISTVFTHNSSFAATSFANVQQGRSEQQSNDSGHQGDHAENSRRATLAGSALSAETVRRNLAACVRMLAPETVSGATTISDAGLTQTTWDFPCSSPPAVRVGRMARVCGDAVTSGPMETPTAVKRLSAKKLTSPKLSRHNDAAYYPNIQCILCKEWVCSRNRYMHIESHLQYRPYKCSVCGYDNRKEIFINLHIKKTHGGAACVEYKPDRDLEHRAWVMAEQCLQHTRDVLQRAQDQSEPSVDEPPSTSTAPSGESANKRIDEEFISKYASQYRPRLYNSQRAEKSLVIEDSLKMGIVPDFTEVSNREVQCQVCEAFIISHAAVMEEHARFHLSQPSYRCSINDCSLEHSSKNFLTRHMKEVHKYRRSPVDITDVDPKLRRDFSELAARCFPEHFSCNRGVYPRRAPVSRCLSTKSSPEMPMSIEKIQSPYITSKTSATTTPSSPFASTSQCTALSNLLRVTFKDRHPKDVVPKVEPDSCKKSCNFCQEALEDDYLTLYRHAKLHLNVTPYECSMCKLSSIHKQQVLEHIAYAHDGHATVIDRMNEALSRQCSALLMACFPGVRLQPNLHDDVAVSVRTR